MSQIKQVWVGIQARSTSERFPRKIFEQIGGKPMLRHVIDTVDRCAFYLNRHSDRSKLQVHYALLCPYRDELKDVFGTRCMIIEGPEDDVLTRYKILADKVDADYIVRVTGDCPLLPDAVITKAIKTALANDYDYCANVDPKCRTAIDGYDVEVISRRAMNWANDNAKNLSDREHVTPILRSGTTPDYFKLGHIHARMDQSHIKLSVDTEEDLERARVEYERRESKKEEAIKKYGKTNVHNY